MWTSLFQVWESKRILTVTRTADVNVHIVDNTREYLVPYLDDYLQTCLRSVNPGTAVTVLTSVIVSDW